MPERHVDEMAYAREGDSVTVASAHQALQEFIAERKALEDRFAQMLKIVEQHEMNPPSSMISRWKDGIQAKNATAPSPCTICASDLNNGKLQDADRPTSLSAASATMATKQTPSSKLSRRHTPNRSRPTHRQSSSSTISWSSSESSTSELGLCDTPSLLRHAADSRRDSQKQDQPEDVPAKPLLEGQSPLVNVESLSSDPEDEPAMEPPRCIISPRTGKPLRDTSADWTRNAPYEAFQKSDIRLRKTKVKARVRYWEQQRRFLKDISELTPSRVTSWHLADGSKAHGLLAKATRRNERKSVTMAQAIEDAEEAEIIDPTLESTHVLGRKLTGWPERMCKSPGPEAFPAPKQASPSFASSE